jgi:hypothetical protein
MFANPRLAIICEPCGRRGRLNVARLLDKQGDAKLTDHMPTPANCDMVYAFSLYHVLAYLFSASRRFAFSASMRLDASALVKAG